MKHVMMMYLKGCPHCKKAFALMEELQKEHPEYQDVKIEFIEESEEVERSEALAYWYVPTYFVDNQKIHEGVPSKEKLKAVLEAAIQV